MSLRIGLQMDHISSIDRKADSTFMLAVEAQKRGYTLHHYQPHNLHMNRGTVCAMVQQLEVRTDTPDYFMLGDETLVELSDLDIILMRQDPPFDMAYIAATHLLEHLQPEVLIINDPVQVRNAPEKLFVTHFEQLMPPTLITTDLNQIEAFRIDYPDIVVKPLFGCGGAGVFHLSPGDDNLSSLMEVLLQSSKEPVMVQQFLPEVREGDKRIVLIEGKPVGAINRIPPKGQVRANMHVGGIPAKSAITDGELAICNDIGPKLRELGLLLAGIDVIGEKYLTEINVTSPTGIQEINRFDGVSLETQIWDAIERRYSAKKH